MGPEKVLNPAGREAALASVLSFITGAATVGLIYAPNKKMIFLSGVIVALSLFFWRLRFRLFYGIIELIFGLYVLYDASSKGHGAFSSSFSSSFDTFQISVIFTQTFGAIYVLIRGLDNCLQGLSPSWRQAIESKIMQWHL
jgi:hypothetical protein